MKKCPRCGRKLPKNMGVCECGHHFTIQREGRSRTAPVVWITFGLVVVLGIIIFGIRMVSASDQNSRAARAEEVIATLRTRYPDKEFHPFVGKTQEVRFRQPMDGCLVTKAYFERGMDGISVSVDYEMERGARPYVTFVFFDTFGNAVLRGYVEDDQPPDGFMHSKFLSSDLNRIFIVATEPRPR